MKALSIRQPWAWAILYAGKDVENRTWSHSYRGPVLIHAAQKVDVESLDALRRRILPSVGINPDRMPGPKNMMLGGIIGRARIVDCISSSPSPWFFGPYGFVLADVEPLPFVPLRGQLGFFEVDESLLGFSVRDDVPGQGALFGEGG